MSMLILALVIAAVVCGVMWRRPDARAVASGAWQAGKAQAVREFREGYEYAQRRLLADNPSWKNPRRWTSWLLAAAYGLAKALAAANRIRAAAWRGARDRYAEWKAAQPVEGEVIDEVEREPDQPQPEPDDPPNPDPDPDPEPDPAPDPEPQPETDPETDQEEQPVNTEAAGLTSYAAAHQEFANVLRTQINGSESLAASMADILAKHSDLIGDTAVLQDLLNQAASVAQGIAERSLTVANN